MDTVYPHCAGLDVHEDTVVACVRHPGGRRARQQVRTFATHTRALEDLAAWLTAAGVTRAAMESTGVYWKPVYNVLGGGVTILLANAQHIKQVPGRKTAAADCAWIAQPLRHGLPTGSFIPPARQRELRDLTRPRSQVGAEQTAVADRIPKAPGDASVNLASVAGDGRGVSGRALPAATIVGQEDPDVLAGLAHRRMRGEPPQLREALRGRVTDHHRFLLRPLLDPLDQLGGRIARVNARIAEPTAPGAEALALPTTIQGIKRHTAEVLLAEVGPTVDSFPAAGQFARWAGMCPGNNETAGKRRTGRTTKGDRWLRQAVVQAGWAASHSKKTSLGARHRRVARRREAGRAVMAVGHTLLAIVYPVPRKREAYREAGADSYDRLQPERLARHLVRRLEQLGHKFTLDVRTAPEAQAQPV